MVILRRLLAAVERDETTMLLAIVKLVVLAASVIALVPLAALPKVSVAAPAAVEEPNKREPLWTVTPPKNELVPPNSSGPVVPIDNMPTVPPVLPSVILLFKLNELLPLLVTVIT